MAPRRVPGVVIDQSDGILALFCAVCGTLNSGAEPLQQLLMINCQLYFKEQNYKWILNQNKTIFFLENIFCIVVCKILWFLEFLKY